MPRRRGRRTAMRAFMGLAAGLLLCGISFQNAGRAETPVTIFAAASTAGAIEAAARDFEAKGGGSVRAVFAASSLLARQIAQGAPADIYLSANVAWMDELARADAIEPDSRIDLLGNSLVLIVPEDRPIEIGIEPGSALAEALGGGRLAIGDPGHVPAGIYAKAALSELGIWGSLAPKLAYTGDARAALALVERGEAAAGVVYASDAASGARVRVVAAFPAKLHPPIVYPLAILRGRARPPVAAFHRYLQGAAARGIFRAQGFTLPAPGRPRAGG